MIAAKEPLKRARRLAQPFDDVVLPLQPALRDPIAQGGKRLVRSGQIVDHDEATNGQAVHHDRCEIGGPGKRSVIVVTGDRAAQSHAPVAIQSREYRDP